MACIYTNTLLCINDETHVQCKQSKAKAWHEPELLISVLFGNNELLITNISERIRTFFFPEHAYFPLIFTGHSSTSNTPLAVTSGAWKSSNLPVIRTWHMVFVFRRVDFASQDTTQRGFSSAFLWATAILNFISTLLLIRTTDKLLSATH